MRGSSREGTESQAGYDDKVAGRIRGDCPWRPPYRSCYRDNRSWRQEDRQGECSNRYGKAKAITESPAVTS